jgi:molybdopterin/thiamine biosynthesis adenylyltransferase
MTERFKDAVWLPKAQSHYITVGGAGGIGSVVTFLLSRIEPQLISIYDDDTVDTINLSNQLFCSRHVGLPKVSAVSSVCYDFSGYAQIILLQEKLTSTSTTSEVMFSCFDNMEARQTMFDLFVRDMDMYANKGVEPIFIDGRLTAEQFYIYVVTRDKVDRYKETLFPDSEAAMLPCGFKGTTHNSFMIASKMVAAYTNFCANLVTEEPMREVPFCIENDIFTMTEIITL